MQEKYLSQHQRLNQGGRGVTERADFVSRLLDTDD